MQQDRPEFLHYKNGLFHGYLRNSRPHGQAICIYDNGAVLVGSFLSDHLSGKCLIMLQPDTYFMGTLLKGMLDGTFVVRSPKYHIYSQTSMNSIQGEVVVIDRQNKRARVWEIVDSQGSCIREGEYEQLLSEQKILRAISPYTQMFPSLQQYLVLDLIKSSKKFSLKTGKTKDKIDLSLQDKITRKINLQFQKERLTAAGIMEKGQIMGFGYLYDESNGLELEGEIYKGMLNGEGLKRQIISGKATFGKFQNGDIRSLQAMNTKSQKVQSNLIKLKRKIHLHSLQFTNDYLNQRPVYLLRNFYQSIVENEQSYSKNIRGHKGVEKQGALIKQNSLNKAKQTKADEFTYNINEYNRIKDALSNRP